MNQTKLNIPDPNLSEAKKIITRYQSFRLIPSLLLSIVFIFAIFSLTFPRAHSAVHS